MIIDIPDTLSIGTNLNINGSNFRVDAIQVYIGYDGSVKSYRVYSKDKRTYVTVNSRGIPVRK